ncbi:hypothetical protein BDV95DRAFT_595766 [Massariosphaeria phaeospora]|uniref:Uncharacterized protein n=1 Tax=Massariosphaeria phaeospora TaxID=100035 RepID=A0A7C8I7N3_9PLEO|nr:hypothetical protein BDV95DRAFT_595766 [Massariosphaeria phaeospora]
MAPISTNNTAPTTPWQALPQAEEAQFRSILFDTIMVLLAGATLVVACLHLIHQRSEIRLRRQTTDETPNPSLATIEEQPVHDDGHEPAGREVVEDLQLRELRAQGELPECVASNLA